MFELLHLKYLYYSYNLNIRSFPADDSSDGNGNMDLRPKMKISPPITGDPDMHARQLESFDHLIGMYVRTMHRLML